MKQMLRGMTKTKIPRQMTLQVLAEDQSSKEQKVDQDGLVEIDFCVALGHTPYGSRTRADLYAVLAPDFLRRKITRRNVCTAMGLP